jgi:hypothetical protein
MKQGSFAQWKLFDDINKWRCGVWPSLAKLDKRGCDL